MKTMSRFVLAAMMTVTAGVAATSVNAATYDWNFDFPTGILPTLKLTHRTG